MNLSTLLGFVSLIGFVMVIAGVAIAVSNASQRRNGRPGVTLALVGLVIGLIFAAASSGLILVGPTQVAVIFQSIGGDPATNSLWPTPLGPGVHIIAPVVNVAYFYSTEVQTYTMSRTPSEGAVAGDDSVQVLTSDGQQVYIDVSVLYSINPQTANTVHLKYQDRYQDDFVRPTVRAVVRDVISGYQVEDLYGAKRTEAQQKILDEVKSKFPDSGLELKDLLVRNITFSADFIKAVELKQVAQQQAEQALQEADRKRILAQGDADAAVTAAKGAASAVIEKAKGDAQSITVNAQAEAQALALINEQISKNPLLVQWRYIEQLAPNINMILLPSNSPFLFDLQSILAQNGKQGTANDTSTNAAQPPAPAATAQPTTP